MSDPAISSFSPLVISPQLRQAQTGRLDQIQQLLEVGTRPIAELSPEQVAAQNTYYNQVQDDIATVRNGTPLPALPNLPAGGAQNPQLASILSKCPKQLQETYRTASGGRDNPDLALRLGMQYKVTLEYKLQEPLPEGPASQNKAMEKLGAKSVNAAIAQEHRRIAWSSKEQTPQGPGRVPPPQPLPNHLDEVAAMNVFGKMDEAKIELTPQQKQRRADIEGLFACEQLIDWAQSHL